MTQVRGHGNNVILDVTQIHADVHTGRDLVILVAALGEAAENVGLATEKAKQGHTILPRLANRSQESAGVIVSHDEHIVLDGVGLQLELTNSRAKGINNIVT